MKFLVLAACVAAAAGQGFFGLQGHPNGAVTPLDEPRVAAAKAEHLATKFGVPAVGYAAAAPVAAYAAVPAAYAAAPAAYAPAAYAAAPAAYAAGYGYAGPVHVPTLVAHPNGAVVAAGAEHLAAKGAEYALNAPVYGGVYAAAAP